MGWSKPPYPAYQAFVLNLDASAGENSMRSRTRSRKRRKGAARTAASRLSPTAEWSEANSALSYERYEQQRMPIPGDTVEFLFTYLTNALGGFLDASAEVKHHFIASVIMMLCSPMNGIEVGLGENVDSDEGRAHDHFDFVLARGTKICIVQVQDGDFHLARAQVFVGCEAVGDRDGQHVVYGIVTDFVSWWIFRCGETSTRMDSCRLFVLSGELGIASLQTLCEMVFRVLASYEEEDKKDHQVAMDENASLLQGLALRNETDEASTEP